MASLRVGKRSATASSCRSIRSSASAVGSCAPRIRAAVGDIRAKTAGQRSPAALLSRSRPACGKAFPPPGWDTDGFHYLKKKQKEDGSWDKGGGAGPDTSFGILFLLRSTKKSIEKTKGYDSGTLAGGQGLPRKLSEARLREGRIVSKPVTGSLPALLDILAHPDNPNFADLVDDPQNIVVQLAEEQGLARDEHLAVVRGLAIHGPAESRRGAVRVLAKLRDIGNAPTLIAALSDNDW